MSIKRLTNKMTIAQLKAFLRQFPEDGICYGYEDEICGIVVTSLDGKKELGYITNQGEEVVNETDL